MKNYLCKSPIKSISLIIPLFFLFSFKADFLSAEYLLKELEIDNSTKNEDDSSVIPTNPFEIVEMIRRNSSLNDATNPSDAINDALESFFNLEDRKEI